MKLDLLRQSVRRSGKRHVRIERPVYTEEEVSRLYGQNIEDESLMKQLSTRIKQNCTCADILQRFLSFFPVISWLPKYQKHYLLRDISAGITLGIMQIPQGMAYGMLTTLPPIYGLYASLIPVLVYFLMGSSKHLSIGTFAIISLMVGEVVQKNMNVNFPSRSNGTTDSQYDQLLVESRIEYAVTVSFLVGAIQFVLGFFRVGFITIFLSDPLISGFTTGAAFHVFSSQVKHLVGMRIPRDKTSGYFSLFKLYGYIFSHIKETNIGALIIGVVATIILFVVKYLTQKYKDKIKFPIPAELIVVILGTGLSYGLKFKETYSIPILENVPKGLPPLSSPKFSYMQDMIIDCVSIAVVSYAISVSVAKAFAKKNNYKVDANQELYAYGAVNMVGSFLSCFVASASLSRSLIQENLGSTQLAGIFASALIVLTLTVLAPLFVYLPRAILAAIVLVALKGLFKQFSMLKVLWKASVIDMGIWIVSFIAVIIFGVDVGLATGLFVNLLVSVVRNSRPSTTLMGQVKGTEIYMDKFQNSLYETPGVKIFQFHAPLFFANVEFFQEKLYESTVNPSTCIQMAVPSCFQAPTARSEPDSSSDKFFMENNSYAPPLKERSFSQCSEKRNVPFIQRSGSFDSPNNLSTKVVYKDESCRLFCPMHTIILECSQICYADTMGVAIISTICNEFKKVDVDVYLANCPAKLLISLETSGFKSKHGSQHIFVSTHDAVQYSLSKEHLKGICEALLKNVNNDASYNMIIRDDSSCSSAQATKEDDAESFNQSTSEKEVV